MAMTSGKWMVLDSQTREVYGVFQDGHDPISTSKFAPNGKFLALGSRDGIIYVYQVSEDSKKFTRMGRCLVCAAIIICILFPDITLLIFSFDTGSFVSSDTFRLVKRQQLHPVQFKRI